MINTITLGSALLTTSNRYCTGIKNGAFPSIGVSNPRRGGYAGLAVSSSKFGSFRLAIGFAIVGSSISDLATQRESFAKDIGSVMSAGVQTLKINKANGVNVQIDVKAAILTGDLKPEDKVMTEVLVEFICEYPALMGQTLNSQDINILNGGGMAIPMAIPMDMSAGGQNIASITNNGNTEAYPLLYLYGPLSNPSIQNQTTGDSLNISTTLATASDYLVVDMYNRTVMLYPAGTNARAYASGDFWTLAPGANSIVLGSGSYNALGKVTLKFRDHYLGI